MARRSPTHVSADHFRRHYGLPLFVLVICVPCVAFARHRRVEDARAVDRERMERRADAFAVKLRERPHAYEKVLRVAAGVFAVSPTVMRDRWRR